MKEKIEKLKNCTFLKLLKQGLASKYFPFVTAAITLFCYYLGLDLVLIYYISLTGMLILLLLDDATPFISVMLFLGIMISYKNSPSDVMGDSDYYFRTANLVQIFIILSLYILTVLYRIILTVSRKKFKFTPAFFGLCGLSAIFLLNGLCSENYTAKNLLYGLIMSASFLGVFCVLKDNIKLDSENYEKIAFAFLAFSAVLITEVVVKYIFIDGIIVDGQIDRSKLTFGWGIWNTMGMWLVMCIPSVIYLAYKKKYGFLYTAYSVLLCLAIFLLNSRQSIIVAAVIYSVCIIILLIKGRYKAANICIAASALITVIVFVIIYRDALAVYIKEFIEDFINGGAKGNTRMVIWGQAIDNYRSAPLFGVGFYTKFSYVPNSGLGFMPYMCHNTILQLLSSCGTIGLIAYIIHRVQTVKCYIKNITIERTFIFITIAGLLLTSLIDNHIFNIFPTIVYSSLTAVIVNDTVPKNNNPPA